MNKQQAGSLAATGCLCWRAAPRGRDQPRLAPCWLVLIALRSYSPPRRGKRGGKPPERVSRARVCAKSENNKNNNIKEMNGGNKGRGRVMSRPKY